MPLSARMRSDSTSFPAPCDINSVTYTIGCPARPWPRSEVLIDWSRNLAAIADDLAHREDAAAREKLTILRRDVQQRRSSVAAVQGLSLYDADRLRQHLVD